MLLRYSIVYWRYDQIFIRHQRFLRITTEGYFYIGRTDRILLIEEAGKQLLEQLQST